MPLPRKRARARLFLFTSVRLLRAAHAPVVVQIASIESARMSTVVCVPCGSTSFARVSAWWTAESSPVLLVPLAAPRNSGALSLVTTRPDSS